MLRFIFACMAVVAVTMIAMPVTAVYDGIQDRRAQVMAEADAEQAVIAAAADEAQPDEDVFAAVDVPEEPSADDLNAIATAAGGFDDVIEDDAGFGNAGFSGTAPAALRGPVAAPTATETPAQ